MNHSTRCANASPSSKCKCSCGNRLHGCNWMVSKTSKVSKIMNSSIIKAIATGTIVITAPQVCPVIVPAYKGYCALKFGKNIYDACNKKNIDFDKILTESFKQGITKVSDKILDEKATKIANNVRLAASEVIYHVSKETKVDEETYGSMLEGSVKNIILSGVSTIASYTFENL